MPDASGRGFRSRIPRARGCARTGPPRSCRRRSSCRTRRRQRCRTSRSSSATRRRVPPVDAARQGPQIRPRVAVVVHVPSDEYRSRRIRPNDPGAHVFSLPRPPGKRVFELVGNIEGASDSRTFRGRPRRWRRSIRSTPVARRDGAKCRPVSSWWELLRANAIRAATRTRRRGGPGANPSPPHRSRRDPSTTAHRQVPTGPTGTSRR